MCIASSVRNAVTNKGRATRARRADRADAKGYRVGSCGASFSNAAIRHQLHEAVLQTYLRTEV